MADVLCNNPITLRGCILYEFLKGNKPFETYKSMMKMFGDEFMEYQEFEFWFMRFAQGNYDLDYDFSLEPKKRQITDLPVELFEKVGDFLHFEDRVNLRTVSKDIQFLVDEWNPKVIEFNYYSFITWSIEDNSSIRYFSRSKDPLVKLLKNPKLRLKKMNVRGDVQWKQIEEELRKSSTKLHVNNLTVENPDYAIDLSLFSLESLEEVTLHINERSVKKMREIVHSEHCKRLKMLTISTHLSPSEFPFGSFIGYPRFIVKIHLTRSEVKIAEFVKKLIKCTQLELFKLEFTTNDYTPTWKSIKEYLNEKEYLVPDSPNLRRYPIRGSTDFYEIYIGDTRISIERKS